MQTIRALRCSTHSIITKSGLYKLNNSRLASTIRNYLIDEKNPYNIKLSARYKKSDAYNSMIKRVPDKIQKIINALTHDRDAIVHKYGSKANEELKEIIRSLAQLSFEIQTNEEFRMFDAYSADKELWNTSLCELGNKNTYFTSSWIFAQCYIYRRIREIFLEQPSLKNYAYFQKQKNNALLSQFGPMILVAKYIDEHRIKLRNRPEKLEKYFTTFVKLDLWSNQLDLSFSQGKQENASPDPLAAIYRHDNLILVNNIDKLWKCITNSEIDRNATIVDFVTDNSGYELFMDLCIGDFLLENCLASCIRFHVKMVPFFISDVMPADFLWTVKKLQTHTDKYLAKLGQRCSDYLRNGRFRLMKEYFWTTGYCFNRLEEIDKALYKTLGDAQLVIFKGDMNYRKLLDMNWEPCTPFEVTLKGFRPSNVCGIRTIKCELICGLKEGEQQKLDAKNPKWMLTGEYGVVQFAGKNKCLN